jgi:hypothetical protein
MKSGMRQLPKTRCMIILLVAAVPLYGPVWPRGMMKQYIYRFHHPADLIISIKNEGIARRPSV